MTEAAERGPGGCRRLLIAIGNPLRGDDGVGAQIAEAVERDPEFAGVRTIVVHQLTPELAETLSEADIVAFVDASISTLAGEVALVQLVPDAEIPRDLAHWLPPASLLSLTRYLYGGALARAVAVTVGGASFNLEEKLSGAARAAIPAAIALLRSVLVSPLKSEWSQSGNN